jgi:hypothetical protein
MPVEQATKHKPKQKMIMPTQSAPQGQDVNVVQTTAKIYAKNGLCEQMNTKPR